MTSTEGSVYIKISFQIPELTSLPSTLTAKKSMKMKFSANKIYYNFSQENPLTVRIGTLTMQCYIYNSLQFYLNSLKIDHM